MQVEKLTALLRNAMGAAQSAAMNANHQKLTGAHLLAALLDDQNMTAKMLLGKAGVDLVGLAASLKSALDSVPQVTGSSASQLHLDNELARIFATAEAEAKARHDQFVGVDIALLAMTRSAGATGKILQKAGIEEALLASVIDNMRKGRTADSETAEDQYDALSRYATDLTEAARCGKLDPVIGRDSEVRRTIQILARRTKNNPVLIGQPGVGKTAIAEGLAQRIVNADVPEALSGKMLLSLDMGALVAWRQISR